MEEIEDDFEEIESEEDLDLEEGDLPEVPEPEMDELSKEFVKALVDKIMQFMELLVGHELHPYQKPLAKRVIESVIINDGEEVTALASRQSGK
jgi:pseudouridine-5'-phosphate glycosidase